LLGFSFCPLLLIVSLFNNKRLNIWRSTIRRGRLLYSRLLTYYLTALSCQTIKPMIAATKTSNIISEATKVTLVGMWLDIALAAGKIIGGLLGNSFALVTDGIHSLTDAVSDIFVLVIARIGQSAPDAEHPWGHGRFETVGTIAMGMLFFATAGILIFDSIQKLIDTNPITVPAAGTIVIALVSIVCKEWIFHYTMNVAKKLNSSLLKANAWHSRSDAISSIAVAIGIAGALLGYPWMDTLAAITVALIIAKIGWELSIEALRELVDTQIPKQRQDQIKAEILSVSGIIRIIKLRSRSSGGKIILELSLSVDPHIPVSEGHTIGDTVSKTLTGQFSDVADVIVHIDPDSGFSKASPTDLPKRQEVLTVLEQLWQNVLSEGEIEQISLQYSEHGISVHLLLKTGTLPASLAAELRQSIVSLEYVTSFTIFTNAFNWELTH
jgi:cation diffusion facilitator family transporter